jgi:putative flippase GtrA
MPTFETKLRQLMERVPWRALGRWWIVGLAFTGGGLLVLYLLRDALHLPLIVATTAGGETTLLLRFLINDHWVFGHRRPTWKRLWQFHVAGAAGGAVWWVVANVLPRFGVNYLLAATAGTACSVVFSMATNFLWVWRSPDTKLANIPVATAETLETLDVD